jgi:NADPH:quinone reductase-like Zn-dependent oxidoreductase
VINSVDGTIQSSGWFPLNYPTILEQGVKGIAAAIGHNVTRFKIGNRVIRYGVGMVTKQNQHMGFQAYTVVQTNMTSELPDDMTSEKATVIPLGYSTAASELFQDEFLNLQMPSELKRKDSGKMLLVWGGASSVWSNTIQLRLGMRSLQPRRRRISSR